MRMPFYDLKAAKQTVSVTINSDLYGQSRRLGVNVSHVAEEALAQAVAARRSEQIRAQIRQDLEALDAYIAQPSGEPKAGIVVVQEIFGVNQHIRSVVDGYAADGYVAIAPAVFDHLEAGVDLGYDQPGMQKGIALISELGFERDVPVLSTWNS